MSRSSSRKISRKKRLNRSFGIGDRDISVATDKELLKPARSRRVLIAVVCLIVVATLAAYWGLWENDFVNFDDNEYITDNAYVKDGLTSESVIWAFTSRHASNWHPLTWLSHMLDCQLYGTKPGGHHVTNLILHTANALLLFFLLTQMTGCFWKSAFVAALFALHPLHVESVAWASERKDVLSTLFWLMTMIFYVSYTRRGRAGMYLAAILAFALGLMAKPMLVTLPFVLLLLDYWPLRRVALVGESKSVIKIIIEKIPFFLLSAASCITTVYVQQTGGAVKDLQMLSLKYRIGNAVVSYFDYIAKTIVPVNLAVYYPHPGDGLSWAAVAVAGSVLIGISVFVIFQAKRRGYFLTGWLWYVGTLVPVIGLVQVGAQAMADRYAYVPSIGLFIIVGWGVPGLLLRYKQRTIILSVLAIASLGALGVCTNRHVGYWRNSITLFEHAAAVTEDNYRAYFNIASAFANAGQIDKAIEYNQKAVRVEPFSAEAHHNLGVQFFKKRKIEKAVNHYKQALRLEPDRADTLNNLAIILEIQGRFDEAIKYYSKAIELKPRYEKAYYGLASCFARVGKREQAIQAYRKVLQINPGNSRAKRELDLLLRAKTGGE